MKDNKKNRFESNKTYFTICIYGILTFCICLMIFKFTNNWKDTWARFADILGMFSPFLMAFLIAYFINPISRRIDRFLFGKRFKDKLVRLHKIISLIISYLLIVGFIILILNFLVPQLVASISELIAQSPAMMTSLEASFNNFVDKNPGLNLYSIEEYVTDNLSAIFEYASTFMTNLLPVLYTAGVSIISWIINLLLAFVISCYLMWDKERLLGSVKRLVYAVTKKETAVKIIDTTRECNQIFSSYIIGKAIDSLIIGIICFLLMTILRLPYAVLISLVVGVTNMIPYFGPFIGAVPGTLILLIISPRQALIFVIMILILQQFDGAILGPKILGDSTGLQPIWIIFAITVGGSVAGVAGMFLGVPVVAVIAHLLNKLVDYMLLKRNIPADFNGIQPPPDKQEVSESQVNAPSSAAAAKPESKKTSSK